jgi:hypothetical protein
MKEAGLPLPPAFQYLILMTLESLQFWFGYGIFTALASKWPGLKVGTPVFQLFYEMKLKTSKFKVLVF